MTGVEAPSFRAARRSEATGLTTSRPTPVVAPLQPGDRENRTVGCRLSNPNVCLRHSLEGKCAFVREDGVCLVPPTSWKKQYARLRRAEEEGG